MIKREVYSSNLTPCGDEPQEIIINSISDKEMETIRSVFHLLKTTPLLEAEVMINDVSEMYFNPETETVTMTEPPEDSLWRSSASVLQIFSHGAHVRIYHKHDDEHWVWHDSDITLEELEQLHGKKGYPFNEGDDYWIWEDDADHVPIKSCWDEVSEELHDANPDRKYYATEEEAWEAKGLPSKVSFVWGIEDVMSQAEDDEVDITEWQARQILQKAKHHHDATIGMNWEVLSVYIGDYRKEVKA